MAATASIAVGAMGWPWYSARLPRAFRPARMVGTAAWEPPWVADQRSNLTAILMTQTMFTSPDLPQVHKDFWRAAFRPGDS